MVQQVHLLFDDPECQTQSPKYFERLYREIKPIQLQKITGAPHSHQIWLLRLNGEKIF